MPFDSAESPVVTLGLALRTHRKTYGLSQTDFDKWAKETQSKGPYGSQISMAERGKLIPQPQFFCSLADFYMALHKQSFKGLSKELAERLRNAGPFLNHKGKPASAADLFEMYVGHQKPNEAYLLVPQAPVEPSEAFAINGFIVRLFESHCKALDVTRQEGFQALMTFYPNSKPADHQRIQGVITGFEPFTTEELTQNMQEGNDCATRIAFCRWLNRELPLCKALRNGAANNLSYSNVMALPPVHSAGAGGPLHAQLCFA